MIMALEFYSEDCAKCGAPGARLLGYAGYLCDPCNEALQKICDFCSSEDAAWRYPAATFDHRNAQARLSVRSIQDWIACEQCHELIQCGASGRLVNRCLEGLNSLRAIRFKNRDIVRRWVLNHHRLFYSHRKGDPFRINN
jgi:hypothetical protein